MIKKVRSNNTFQQALHYLLVAALVISSHHSYAQTAKLSGAFNYSTGIVIDSKGAAFIIGRNSLVIKISPDGKAALFAGGGHDNKDGKGALAGLGNTKGIAIDAAGNLYITNGSVVRKVTPDAVVSTIAGNGNYAVKDGDRTTASFLSTEFIAVDGTGNIYVTDKGFDKEKQTDYNIIRKITPQGKVTTINDAGTGKEFRSHWIRGLVCDKEGNLYACVLNFSSCIKKITPDGVITNVAGKGDAVKITAVYKEGDIKTAQIVCPTGIAINQAGNIFFSDVRLHRIIKIANQKVSTAAGNGKISFSNTAGGAQEGYADGKAGQALFYAPAGLAFDNLGNLFIVDGSSRPNSYIRKLSINGMVSTFCKHEWNPKTQHYEAAD